MKIFGPDVRIKLPNMFCAFGLMIGATLHNAAPPFWLISVVVYVGLGYLCLTLLPFNLLRLRVLENHTAILRKLARQRRTFGLMTALWFWAHYHLAVTYLRVSKPVGSIQKDYDQVLDAGQMAIFIFLILFITSYDWAKRLLKSNWKRLQSLVWFAVPLVLVHSISAKLRIQEAYTHISTAVLLGLIGFAVYETIQLNKRGHADKYRHVTLIGLGLAVGLFLRFAFRDLPIGV